MHTAVTPRTRPSRSGVHKHVVCTAQVLCLEPHPTVASSVGRLENDRSYVFAGEPVSGAPPLRLGLLNIASDDAPRFRSANIVLQPEHPFWQERTADGVYAYLARAFPQIDRWSDALPRATAEARP